jgi:phage/plasmid-like protein (TIGR03299 family)
MSRETIEWLNDNTLIGFTSKRGTAWHDREGSDNHFDGAIPLETVRERLFNWEAIPSPVYIEDGDGFKAIPNRTAWSRSDNGFTMGVFTDGYQGHGYSQTLLKNVSHILDVSEGELAIGSAGLLRGGGQAWVQIEMEETVKTEQGFDFRPFLLAVDSFDGTLALSYGRKIQATVCDNTMEAALSESGQSFKLKHTKNSGLKLSEARDALNIIYDTADTFSAELKALCETTVTDDQWNAFLDLEVPLPTDPDKKRGITMSLTKRDELNRLYKKDERVAPWTGTKFGVLQATNTYAQHSAIFRGAQKAERVMSNVLSGKSAEQDKASMMNLNRVLQLA